MTPEWISKIFAGILLFFFWIVAGLLISPFWLIIAVIGAILGVYEWKEAPKMFYDLVMIRWFLD